MTSSAGGCDTMHRVATTIPVFVFCFCYVNAILENNALYVTNATHILIIDNRDTANGATARPVYSPTNDSRIVGLAYIRTSGLLFWSDINRWTSGGIYRAQTDSSGNLSNITRIIGADDVLEVNGLTADWVSNNIYWTDGRKRTIEVADQTGTNRRILFYENLVEPRGIYADPIDGWLYWNDQGTHRIERSRLDGSAREVYVGSDSNSLPNQMVVYSRALYWVDSHDKTLRSTKLDNPIQLSSATSNGHVFGLAINDNIAYVTSWSSTAQLLKIDLTTKAVTITGSSLSRTKVFSAVFVSSNVQNPNPDYRPCSSNSCNQLCLPTVESAYRCSCSSYGGKTLQSGTSCQTPTNILLYTVALANSGYVGFYDPSSGSTDLYLVGRSSRPVAVAYDIVNQMVYWSDVREQTIYRSKLNGSGSAVFLDSSDGVGIVDGMAVDYVRRQLYYSNIGSVTIEGKTYSWHKVETVNIDGYEPKVKTMLSDITDKPRAIAIDVTNAKLYFTDWGSKASVISANLDGSNPVVLKTGLYNPNGLVLSGNYLYVADSNYKTRTLNLGTPLNGSLYRMSTDGSGWTVSIDGSTALSGLKTPFGLASDGVSTMYVSDWGTNSIFSFNINQAATQTRILTTSGSPMGLSYTAVSLPPSANTGTRPCATLSCGDICLSQTSSRGKCSCKSYGGKALKADQQTCAVPAGYLLVSDMDGVKLVSLDSNGDPSVYVTTKGNPFDSNVVALTYHAATNTIYFSDVERKAIYAYFIANETSTEFYRVNHVIDGMTIDRGTLYWTDSKNGQIVSRLINSDSANRTHTTILTGLNKPRAIKVYNGYIYWTEWGTNPRVARMPVDRRAPTDTYSNWLNWPNALFMDKDRIYIADGFTAERKLINCSLSLSDCRTVVTVTSDNVQHMYDIWIANDILYYTDWNTSSVNALSLTTGISLQPLVTGLVRPAQLYFSTNGPNNTNCSLSSLSCTGPGSSCIQTIGKQQCQCAMGSTLNTSTTCVASQSLSCGIYSIGSTFQSQDKPCLSCQCLPNRFYGNALYYYATCETITCPTTYGCSNPTIPPGKCCPICQDSKCLRITNCPTSTPIEFVLPSNRPTVEYTFSPVIEDCLEQNRDIQTKYDNVIFRSGSTTATLTVSASNPLSSSPDVDTCTYTVKVVDLTPPSIDCPPERIEYTTGTETLVAVKWQAPKVSDNAGTPDVASRPTWGSDFQVNTKTLVTYTATDSSSNTNTCTFSVTVTRLSGATCQVPRLLNGNLSCSAAQSAFTCSIVCNSGYTISGRVVVDDLTCTDNQWNEIISDDFERLTCIRSIGGAVQGSIGVTVGNVCSAGVNLPYTEGLLASQLEVTYRYASAFDLGYSVKANCTYGTSSSARLRRQTSSSDMNVVITVSGDYQNDSEMVAVRNDIDRILSDIGKNLLKSFLVIRIYDGTHVRDAPIDTNSPIGVTLLVLCPPGTYNQSMRCVICPAGTFQTYGACKICPNGTYNDKERQTSCKSCPNNRVTAKPGAYIIDQCIPTNEISTPTSPTYIIIGVVVGVGGFILIIIVIVVVIVCVKKRRHNKDNSDPTSANDGKRSTENTNVELNPYDYISPTPEAGSGEQIGQYETLGVKNTQETFYDAIQPAQAVK